LLSGQVLLERTEVARKLDIHEPPGAAQDAAIGRALYARAWQHIREQPGAWLALLAHKAWLTIGNHPFVHDYDMNGERELLGAHHLWGIPFGVLLALGWLGLLALWRTQRTLWWVLVGQLCAVLAANVLVFTSAQNRMPLAIPLALAAGPGLMTLRERARDVRDTFRPSVLALGVSAMLLAQAFWPRLQSSGRPSSVHYFNLASIEELLGRNDAALAHYAQAAQRKPDQPFFALRHAIMLRRTGQAERARAEARRGLALPNLDPALRGALQSEATRDAAP